MKRITMFVAMLSVFMFATITNAGTIVFQEDFENYGLNTWPSTWIKDANASSDPSNNKIVTDPANYSDKVLQLYGVPDGNWAAIGYHEFQYSDSLLFNFSIFSGSGDTHGNQPDRGYVGITNGPQWYSTPGLSLFYARLIDGNFHGIGGGNLGSFQKETWYDVEIEYFRNEYDISAKYWINGNYVGDDAKTISFSTDTTFGYLQLHSGDRVALFDDITISTGSGPNPVPEPTSMLLLGTGLIGLAGIRRKVKSEGIR